MAKPQKFEYLLEKSQQAALSAIEIYNKPDFKYREEVFSILMVNAWELLLKAKILKDHKNILKSIYIQSKTLTKDQKKTKRFYVKKNRAGNPMTIDIYSALKKQNLDPVLVQNISLLIEIRDNSIHFINKEKLLQKKILEIGIATLKSYVTIFNEWFDVDLSKYNFYLMPLSFFHPAEIESYSIAKFDTQTKNILRYIKNKERYYPSDENKQHHVSLQLKTTFEKVPKSESNFSAPIRIVTDKNAPAMRIEEESLFKNKYIMSHTELIDLCKKRYSDFKTDKKFNDLKTNLIKKDLKYSKQRHVNIKKPKDADPFFYSAEVYKLFDKYYKKI